MPEGRASLFSGRSFPFFFAFPRRRSIDERGEGEGKGCGSRATCAITRPNGVTLYEPPGAPVLHLDAGAILLVKSHKLRRRAIHNSWETNYSLAGTLTRGPMPWHNWHAG